MTKEQMQNITKTIKSSIGDENFALVSNEFMQIETDNSSMNDTISDKDKKINELQTRNTELISVNGKLFQKVGNQIDVPANQNNTKPKDDEEKVINIHDLIDEKGGLIK